MCMDTNPQLSKKERIRLKHEGEKMRFVREERNKKLVKWGIWVVVGLLIAGGFWWVIAESSKPLPGRAVKDLGRGHIPVTEKVIYNSNPPTSGKHYAEWTKAGIYDQPVADGHLVHSLEHGYIIISYNCERNVSRVPRVPWVSLGEIAYAHETDEPHEEPATPSAVVTGEAWNSGACATLKKQLADIANEQKLWKLIVMPRENLDVPLALTAWGRIEKLQSVDKAKITAFIDAFRDKGPEKTME